MSYYNFLINPNIKDFGVFEYADFGEHVLIVKIKRSNSKSITIPRDIDGKIVSSITIHAFANTGIIHIDFAKDSEITSFYNERQYSYGFTADNYGALNDYLLQSIKLPPKLVAIPSKLFYNQSRLTSIEIPASVQYIKDEAFACTTKLSNIVFENNSELYMIGKEAFRSSGIERLFLPKELTGIEENCFKDTKRLYSVEFEDNSKLQYIHHDAFTNSGLVKIRLPKNVYLNQSIFSNTPNLDEVTFDIESNINEIPKYLFYESGLKKITLPKSVKKIGTRAFYETINLEQVMFEKDSELIEIENEAFLGSGLKEIIFPDKINRIGQQAFFNLRNLHEIFIPKNIQYIDYANFTSRSGNLTVYTELPKQQPGWNPYWNRYHRAETSDEYQTHEAITFPETRVVYNCNFKNMVIPLNEHLIKVAGVSFENRQNIIKNLHTGEQLILVREKNNSFDSNAIGVHTLYGEQIGYIPKDINHFFAMKMDDGTKYSAYISSIYGGYEGMNLGLTIKLIAK